MEKLLRRLVPALGALISLTAGAAQASELQGYVQQCQTELQFNASEVPALNCNDGFRFAGGAVGGHAPLINDYVTYKRINDKVDLAVACRWLIGHSADPSLIAASVELLIHNRQNGSTCFFSAKATGDNPKFPVSTAIVSPTDFHNKNGNPLPNADDYWEPPSVLNTKQLPSDQNISPHASDFPNPSSFTEPLRCVGCHVQGPYIASSNIVPYLARFGLLNNGHDTIADMTAPNHYHAVGSSAYDKPGDPTNLSAFKAWDSIIYANMYEDPQTHKPIPDCSSPCHSLGAKSSIGSLFTVVGGGDSLLPSLTSDIQQLRASGAMEPDSEDSNYRWINRDTPSTDGIEIETFTSSKNTFPIVPFYCGAPTNLEAHVVDSSFTFSTVEMGLIPDKLKAFNLRDGLVCLNADQGPGKKCYDYAVSYTCKDGRSTQFYNNDKNVTDDGDHEERVAINSLVTSFCGAAPIGIQAQVLEKNGFPIAQVKGPNDKLQQFAPSGLICKNSDQSDGQQCSNYVVRYRGCRPFGEANLAKIRNAWINPPTFTNRFLTTTNNESGSETRAQANNYEYPSQDWIIEPISDTKVRMKDVWSGKYLAAPNGSEFSTVVVKDLDANSTLQQWNKETVQGNSNEVRFKNIATGFYLTVGNYTTEPYFAPIISQLYSSQNWASQRWLIQ